MKKTALFILALFSVTVLFSQTVIYHENFELPSLADSVSMDSGGFAVNQWAISTTLASQGLRSDSCTISQGDTTFLTTDAFSTVGNSNVMLYFSHICKIEFFDAAEIFVSNDNGTTWTKLTGTHYLGNGSFTNIGNKFASTSYTVDWLPANNNAIPTNSWWKNEQFDISTLAGNSAQVKIRFQLTDANNSGPAGNYGWLLDNIIVLGSFSELIPPTLTMVTPIVQDTVYSTGPYQIETRITDASGIDTAMLIYTVSTGFKDTLGMSIISPDTFSANIPFFGFGKTIQYYVKAIDASAAHNFDSTSTYSFYCKYSSGGTFTVGTGTVTNSTTGWPAPYGNWYWGSKHQMLIAAADLAAVNMVGGQIESLAFAVSAVNTCPALQNFTIKIKTTTLSAITTAWETGLTTVYTNSAYQPIVGWNLHQFQTPFNWDGVSNIIIETCFNNSGYLQNASMLQTATTYASTHYAYADNATNCTAPSTGYTSNQRPNMQFVVSGVLSLDLDIGAYQITNPIGGVLANQDFPVKFNIKNFGTDSVVKATVHWELDNVLQAPFTFLATNYDTIWADSVSAEIILDTLNLGVGAHSIKIWTLNPNDTSDYNSGNDTAYVSFYACSNLLSGNYNIGGTSPDFANFSAAALALDQCGISGPVVFTVASGTYNEQIELPFVSGSTATNTITFKSATADSTDVILTYNASPATGNYTLKLDGTSHITFKDMTFAATDSSLSKVIEIGNMAENVHFLNNRFLGVNNSAVTDEDGALIHTIDSVGNNITILNNAFIDGSIAINIEGGPGIHSTGFQVKNNTVTNCLTSGITLANAISPVIKENSIYSTLNSATFTGIACTECYTSPQILKNNIVTTNTQIAYGIRLTSSNGNSLTPGLVANNFVLVNGSSTANTISAGILNNEAKNINYYYNTVNITGNQANAVSMCLFDATAGLSENINIVNNIFSNEANGYTYYVTGVDTAKFFVDYNDIYNPGNGTFAYLGAAVANFAAWKTKTAEETNSITINPYFSSAINLHTTNNLLNGTATPIAGITDDIDGDLRNASTPDIGADEFAPSPYDLATLEILAPVDGCGLDTNETVTIRIKNLGSATVTGGFTASYKVNNNTAITESVSSTLLPGDTLDYNFTTVVDLDVSALMADSTFDFKAWVDLTTDPVHYNDTAYSSVESGYQPPAPIVSDTTINYGNNVTLSAYSVDSVSWWASTIDTVGLGTGSTFTTPALYDTTVYWVSSSAGIAGTGGNIAPLAVASASPACNTGACSTLNDLNFGTCGSQQMWITSSASNPGSAVNVTFIWPTPKSLDKMTIHVGSSTTRFLTGGTIQIWNGAAWVNHHTFTQATGVCNYDIDFPNISTTQIRIIDITVGGTQTSNVNFREIEIFEGLGGGCSSARIPLTVNVIGFPSEDAGISQMINPSGSLPSGVPHEIKVEVKNFGFDTLQTANIQWTLNGLPQDSVVWTGSLLQDSTEVVIIDTMIFNGGIYCIDSWTTMPNGVPDTINANDTSSICFNACLSGTYTIGDTTGSANFDFPTFNSAVSALTLAGVCGNVTFLADSGTYYGQLTIPVIPGAGPNATITFRSASGDSTDVVIQYTATGSTNNWVVRFNGADYVEFKQLTLKALNASYARVVEMIGGATHNTIESCELQSLGTSSNNCGLYDYTTMNHYNTYRNNVITNGYYGIYIRGASSTSLQKGTIIEGNVIDGFYYYGIYAYGHDSIIINQNLIKDGTTAPYPRGIYSYYCDNGKEIIGNSIYLTPTSYAYGMYVYYSDATSAERGIIANNFISIVGGSTSSTNYGIYDYNSSYQNFYYNSVSINSGSTSSRCLYLSSGSNQNFKNNIFTNTGTGYAFYINTPTAILSSDYNDFYVSGNNLAYWSGAKTSLAALQTASGKDVHSVSINPPFTSLSDLHLSTTGLSALGTPIPGITTDIDGDPRSPMPTIGADEVPLIAIDAGVSNIITPAANAQLNESASIPVTVVVTNFGTDTIYGMNIQYSVNNGTPVTVAYNDTLLSFASDSVTMPNFISPAGNSNICAKTILTGDTNAFNDESCNPFFGIPSWDAVVVDIIDIPEGCGLTTDTVKMRITNVGVYTINGNITASYSVEGLTPITQAVTDSIPVGDTIIFPFTQLVNFATTTLDTIIDIKAWVTLTGDNVHYNDTALTDVESFHTPPAPTAASPILVPYASPATLTASSSTNDTLIWYTDSIGGSEVYGGTTFITPFFNYVDTTFWVEARGGSPLNYYTFGTGALTNTTTGYPAPYGQFYNGARHQMLIPASELIAQGMSAGPINSLSFNVQTANGVGLINFEIKLGSTSLTALSSWLTGLTSVYSVSSYTEVSGWNEHTFTTPYIWDGSSNLIIETCFDNFPNGYTYNAVMYQTTTAYASTIYYRTDGGSACTSGSPTTANQRPDMKLYAGGGGCSSTRVPVDIIVTAPLSCDVGVFKITQPISAINLTNSETVQVKVKNYGTAAQTNIPVYYQIGINPPVGDTITATINPGDSLTFTFGTPANLGIGGNTYNFKAYTSLSCDSVYLNDTCWKSVQNMLPNYCACSATSTGYEDITNVSVSNLNNTTQPLGTLYSDFTASVAAVQLSPGVSYPISISNGFVPSNTYQYGCWINVFIDFNRDGVFDATTENAFAIQGTSSGTFTGTLNVPFNAMQGLTRMRVAMRESGSQANTGPCGTFTWGEVEDYNVSIAPLIAHDAGVIDIIQPQTLAASPTTPIEVIVVNYGTASITSVDVSYELNSGTPVTQTYTGLLLTGDSAYVLFPTITLPTGQNSICAYTTLPLDSNAFNDQKCINSYVQLITTPPFFDNFEGTDYWLPDTLLNQWERGIPAATNINTAHSPTKVWMIDLDATYANNSNDYLYTPKFDFAAVTPDSLSFWHYYNTQANNDGGRIQYLSTSGYWINMGSQNDTNGVNWFNTFNGLPFWSGNSNGWIKSSYKLSALTGLANPAQFRFVFASNASSNNFDGWAIDDFAITIPKKANDPGVTAILTPTDSTQIGSTETVYITIKNFGTNTLLTIPVYYMIDNNTPISETWSGILAPDSTVNFTFIANYQSPSNDYSLCAWATGVSPTYTQNDSICKNIIVTPASYDVGICNIEEPIDTLYCDVKVWIKNYGMNTVSSVNVFYHLNGMNKISDTWTGTLAPNDSVQFIFPGQANAPIGMFSFCAGTDYTGDLNLTNDSLCKSVVGKKCPSNPGFSEFENNGFILNQNIPNPTTGITQIGYTVPTAGTIRFDLMNVLGQSMQSQEKTVMAGSHTLELYVGDLPAGVYYYSVIFEGRRLVKKMVINR